VIGLVALGVLLVYVTIDAFDLANASPEWLLTYFLALVVPFLAFCLYSVNDPAVTRRSVGALGGGLVGVAAIFTAIEAFVVAIPRLSWQLAYLFVVAMPVTAYLAYVGEPRSGRRCRLRTGGPTRRRGRDRTRPGDAVLGARPAGVVPRVHAGRRSGRGAVRVRQLALGAASDDCGDPCRTRRGRRRGVPSGRYRHVPVESHHLHLDAGGPHRGRRRAHCRRPRKPSCGDRDRRRAARDRDRRRVSSPAASASRPHRAARPHHGRRADGGLRSPGDRCGRRTRRTGATGPPRRWRTRRRSSSRRGGSRARPVARRRVRHGGAVEYCDRGRTLPGDRRLGDHHRAGRGAVVRPRRRDLRLLRGVHARGAVSSDR